MRRLPENKLSRDIYMKITIIISTRLFILFPNLITKESYNWWVTRRVWGFRHQISKAKYLKILIANIGKLQEKFHSKRAAKFRSKRTTFSQPKADFAAVQNLPSAWSDWLPMAVTPSFQLRIAYRLKHWIFDFLSFETTYSMQN